MEGQTFAGRLAGLRKEKGISQKTAATELGVSQALLSHYEKGIRECPLAFVVKVADYYSVSCDFLLGHENSSVRIDNISHIADIEEDAELSIGTMYRASLIIGKRCIKDETASDFMLKYYTLSSYVMMVVAAKRSCIPKSWLIEDNINMRRLDYLISSMRYDIESMEDVHTKKIKRETSPRCVKTISDNINDYLNIYISELM